MARSTVRLLPDRWRYDSDRSAISWQIDERLDNSVTSLSPQPGGRNPTGFLDSFEVRPGVLRQIVNDPGVAFTDALINNGYIVIALHDEAAVCSIVGERSSPSGVFYTISDLNDYQGNRIGDLTIDDLAQKSRSDTRYRTGTITVDDQQHPATVRPTGPPPPPPVVPPGTTPVLEPPAANIRSRGFQIEMKLQSNLAVNNGWVDITDELHGTLGKRIVRTFTMHNDLSPVVNSCKITLFGSDRIADIFNYTPRDLPVRIYKDGQPWFSGFIRGEVSASFRGGGICTFEVVDRSFRLDDETDVYLGEDDDGTPWTELPVATEVGDKGLINRILNAHGVDVENQFHAIDIPQVLPRFASSGDEGKKWIDILYPIMFEYGYALNVRPDGSYEMLDLFPRRVTPIALIGDNNELEYSTESNISRTVNPVKTNSTRVLWYPQTIKEDMVLFELTQGSRKRGDIEFRCWVEVNPGRFYPTGASETLATYSVYQQVDGYRVVAAYNQQFEFERLERIPDGVDSFDISPIVKRTEEHHPLFSDIRLQAAATGDKGVIIRYRITGDAVVQDNLTEHRYLSIGLEGSKNIKELKTQWIIDGSYAQRLADGYTHHSIWGSERLTFEGVNYNLNEVYDIRSNGLVKVNGLYRVVQVSENDIGRQVVIVERIPRGSEVPA